jgi:hypothetical protein
MVSRYIGPIGLILFLLCNVISGYITSTRPSTLITRSHHHHQLRSASFGPASISRKHQLQCAVNVIPEVEKKSIVDRWNFAVKDLKKRSLSSISLFLPYLSLFHIALSFISLFISYSYRYLSHLCLPLFPDLFLLNLHISTSLSISHSHPLLFFISLPTDP